jgi:hypothetical protein
VFNGIDVRMLKVEDESHPMVELISRRIVRFPFGIADFDKMTSCTAPTRTWPTRRPEVVSNERFLRVTTWCHGQRCRSSSQEQTTVDKRKNKRPKQEATSNETYHGHHGPLPQRKVVADQSMHASIQQSNSFPGKRSTCSLSLFVVHATRRRLDAQQQQRPRRQRIAPFLYQTQANRIVFTNGAMRRFR